MYDTGHSVGGAPRWARPQGQEGRCRCSHGLHVTTHQALAASPSAQRVQTEGAWLKPLPAVLAVWQCEKHLHTTGRGLSPSQSACSPVSVGLGHCNTGWARAVRLRDVSRDFTGVCCKVEKHFSVMFIGLDITGIYRCLLQGRETLFCDVHRVRRHWNLPVFAAR